MIAQKKRKVSGKRVAIVIGCLFVVIALVAGGTLGLMKLFAKNPYEKYDKVSETDKKYGTMKHESDEEEDVSYKSIFYPEFKEKELNTVVTNYRKEHEKLAKHNGMQILTIDYDVNKLFDHYVVLNFHKTIYDEKEQLIQKETTSYNYNLKTKKVLTLPDVLRRNYKEMLENVAKEQNLTSQYKTSKLNDFIITDKSVILYLDAGRKNKLEVPYEKYKAYIKLQDPKIPSYYQKEAVVPAKEPKVDPNKPMIAFTFDDGPSQYTSLIMDEFEKYGGRATFFMLGQNVEQYPDVVKEVHKRGFELGNHSWTHSTEIARSMSRKGVSDEIYNTQDAIYKLTGQEPSFLRPPFGAVNDTMLKANYIGYAFWDIDSLDWKTRNANSIYNEIMRASKKGNIVSLQHDLYEPTLESVRKLLPELKSQGYQFVTYSTLKKYEGKYLENLDATYGVPAAYSSGR